MLKLLQFLTVVIVALPTALAVAHSLELPGKLRLDERTYRAVNRIYYPGFTIGGHAEPLASRGQQRLRRRPARLRMSAGGRPLCRALCGDAASTSM